MDQQELDKSFPTPDESISLNRNRSFKTKQLVRSQAIRESTSPPRTISPNPPITNVVTAKSNVVTAKSNVITAKSNVTTTSDSERTLDNLSDTSSQQCSDNYPSVSDKPVEIQITGGGAWEDDIPEPSSPVRWSQQSQCSGQLLSNSPQRACVCERNNSVRKVQCPTKQDSGIVCPDDCADISDNEGDSTCDLRKTGCDLRKTGCDLSKAGCDLSKAGCDLNSDEAFCTCTDRKRKPKSSLSRTDSDDRTDLAGPELVHFIRATLNKNMRDRATLLKIERELHALVNDPGRSIVRFPVMTSYGRMLVHRCAALFQLSHHLDAYNKACVIVSKSGTSGGRIPCTAFKSWCAQSLSIHQGTLDAARDNLHKSILKRDALSLDEGGGNGGASAVRSKSLEQREREYERVRRRIFSNQDSSGCSQEEGPWPWSSGGPVKLLTSSSSSSSDPARSKLLKVQSLESAGAPSGPQSWRSKGAVSKSHSFGGYGGDDHQQTATNRVLSRQGDLASSSWRLSPSSSGYKTLSLRSTDSVTPSPTGGVSPEPPPHPAAPSGTLLWAVTDLSRVPHGALIIHPQTGQPLTNPDGSLYRYDPANPPVAAACPTAVPPVPHVPPAPPAHAHTCEEETPLEQGNDKRRGRLEKQHSFIDSECGCAALRGEGAPAGGEGCCCVYAETETICRDEHCDKLTNQQQEPPTGSPIRTVDSTSGNETANPAPRVQPPTNHRPPPGDVANQRADNVEDVCSYTVQQDFVPYKAVTEIQVSSPSHVQTDIQTVSRKSTPVATHDPHIRPMSLTGVVYPTQLPLPTYTYTNHCRMESTLAPPLYQPVAPPGGDEPKPHQDHEPTFRIDPSYPYPSLDVYGGVVGGGAAGGGYSAPCAGAACVLDTLPLPHPLPVPPPPAALHHHRGGYNVGYTSGMEHPALMPGGYPVGGVMQYPVHQYHQPLQWQGIQPILATQAVQSNCGTPIQKPTTPPNIYLPQPDLPLTYHHQSIYNQNQPVYQPIVQYQTYPYTQACVLPQMVPQQFYQPVYPVLERQDMMNPRLNIMNHRSLVSSPQDGATVDEKTTPYHEDNDKRKFVKQASFQEEKKRTYVRSDSVKSDLVLSGQNSNELAMTIQQIKDQMAHLNTQERSDPRVYTRNDRKQDDPSKGRRNNGSGILGSYPANSGGFSQHQNRVMGRPPINDESQLSSAARAIVNSIRNIQTKSNTYPSEPRQGQGHSGYQGHHQHRSDHQQQYQQQHRTRHHARPSHEDTRRPPGDGHGKGTDDRAGVDQSDRSGSASRPMERRVAMQHAAPAHHQYRPHYVYRQMTPGTWCRRSPAPIHPSLNAPRRPPHPDSRNQRR